MPRNASFSPDWVSPPGRTVTELLRHHGMSREEFASESSLVDEEVQLLFDGKMPITVKIANHLEQSIGGSVEFWIARDFQYREDAERLFGSDKEWLRKLPVSDMRRFGWLEASPTPSDETKCCLDFFGVESVAKWHEKYDYLEEAVLFRRSENFDSRPASVAAWLRMGELEAARIKCKRWSPGKFQESLEEVRKLTRKKDPNVFLPRLRELCAACGVALVVARTPSGCPASGATRFLNDRKAMLLLSFRHMTDDHFWFSFFHEAAHLILHHPHEFMVEGVGDRTAAFEEEANEFAQDTIVPDEYVAEMKQLKSRSIDIMRFARKVGVSPGLIVGQLQHRKILSFNQQNRLKQRYEWM